MLKGIGFKLNIKVIVIAIIAITIYLTAIVFKSYILFEIIFAPYAAVRYLWSTQVVDKDFIQSCKNLNGKDFTYQNLAAFQHCLVGNDSKTLIMTRTKTYSMVFCSDEKAQDFTPEQNYIDKVDSNLQIIKDNISNLTTRSGRYDYYWNCNISKDSNNRIKTSLSVSD